MTGKSKFILRWEIENAEERFATGRVESGVFDEEGFNWTIVAEKDANRYDKTNLVLKCDTGHNGEWKCDAEVEVRHIEHNEVYFDTFCTDERFCFSGNSERWSRALQCDWDDMTLGGYILDDNVVVLEFHISVISSESGKLIAEPSVFSAPNKLSNVILKIGDEKIHVSKEYLSIHSPVFETLFFGEFAEKGKEEVEIKDVVYVEFLDLLDVIYFKTLKLTDRKVVYILKLADRFQMKDVFKLAKMYLTESKGINVFAKLILAEQYNLVDLKNECFQSFKKATELLQKMLAFPEYEKISADMKAAICDRMKELNLYGY